MRDMRSWSHEARSSQHPASHLQQATDSRLRYTTGHLGGLRRFAVAITVLTLLGHTVLGFEQSYAQPLVAVVTAYLMQILLECVSAWCEQRRPHFTGGLVPFVDFLLSAHITALSITMLLYFNDRLWVVAFATAVGIGSKTLFRVPVGAASRHFFNPSNFGVSVILLLFPWVGLAMPWQYSAGVTGIIDWLLVALIFTLGTFINSRYTGRILVVIGFLAGFILQAVLRALLFDTTLFATLMPATGVPAMIYTFYMVPDPSTTPSRPWAQVIFGGSVAAVYCLLMALHVVFGLFFALTIVCAVRGLGMYVMAITANRPKLRLAPAGPPAA
jgi:enediyne biosynthesis protein E5